MAKKKAAPVKAPAKNSKKPAPKKATLPPAKKAAAPAPKKPMAPAAPAKSSNRLSWLDVESGMPLIEKYARQLDSFLETMADGIVEEAEIKNQEKRLTKLMKDVEPQLNDDLHAKVTKLLCELTAYDLMQTLFAMQQARPKTVFRG